VQSLQSLDSSWLDAPPAEPRATDSAAETRRESWVARNPATTQPLAPTTPIAPPTAPTLVAVFPDLPAGSTARGLGAPSLGGEPSPAITARGFPPQSYPIQPPVPGGPPPQGSGPPYSPPVAPYLPSPVSPTYVSPSPPASSPQGSRLPAYSPPGLAAPPPSPLSPVPQAMYVPSPSAPTYVPSPSAPTYVPSPSAPAYAPAAPVPPAPVLLEVTPRGLGIATVAGFCEELIRRNSRVPTEARKLFITSRDNQDQVRIVVCQGESRRLDNNTVIGDLVLQGLPPRPRGDTSIEVTFALDASGVLQVRARDAQTGAEQRAALSLVGGVSQEDVAASRDRLQQLRR
jgi:molecular chaperone DnaK